MGGLFTGLDPVHGLFVPSRKHDKLKISHETTQI